MAENTHKLKTRYEKWEIVGKLKKLRNKETSTSDLIDILLANRGIKTAKQKKEFFSPEDPQKISLKSLGVKQTSVKKAIERIKKVRKKKEKVIIYGDYDADGVCATAILWETLYALKLDVLPHIPGRFDEGYGLNSESVRTLKDKYPDLGLIVTVDNGIVAHEAVKTANEIGVDVIITDHHQKEKLLPKAYSIVHTDKICGAALSWIFAREIVKKMKGIKIEKLATSLDLVAIGTIADQVSLVGASRSFAKHGLDRLNKTKRLGLLALFAKAGVVKGEIGPYEIGFVIAPRINAMGRLEHAIDSMRLVCTKNVAKAEKLANLLNKTNLERQRIVDEVVAHAREKAQGKTWDSLIILAHESYHEGVIGLAAAKLVEEYGRPAIVLAKGDEMSKASARSISGFNIIEAIRKLDDLLVGGGGHPMAAGFSIKNDNLDLFSNKLTALAKPLLTKEVMDKRLKIDLEVNFNILTKDLYQELAKFAPTGIGNPTPTFVTRGVEVLEARTVGRDAAHLKCALGKADQVFNAIAFGFGDAYFGILKNPIVDIVYTLDLNVWNGKSTLQLKLKDIKPN